MHFLVFRIHWIVLWKLSLELMNALTHLQELPSRKLRALLPNELCDVMKDKYVWPHDQRELDQILAGDHDAHYDMSKIEDQQDRATMISTGASILMLISRSEFLRVSAAHLSCKKTL